jgi:hypothetical protein
MNRRQNTFEEKEAATQVLFDHQKYAQLAIWVRSEWKRAFCMNMFQKEHLQINFAVNPRCPYMELGQAFYNCIMGVSVFIVVSSLQNHMYVYMLNEQTAKKGSDKVISLMKIHFNKYLNSTIVELDIHCDGYAGRSWNNRLALFCEEMVDPESGIRNDIDLGLECVDLYRGVSGHTYMQPDSEGGHIQRAACKILLTRGKMFIHAMAKDESVDPTYTKSWAEVAQSLDNMADL